MVKPLKLAGLVTVLLGLFATPVLAKSSILLFDKSNGTGTHYEVTEPVKNLSGSGFNNKAKSAVVVSGKWELCSAREYEGDCVTLAQGLHNLGGLANRVTSLRPVSGDGGSSAAVLLFTGKDGSGKWVRLTESKSNLLWQYPEISDRISSIAIFAGQWEFCKKSNYKGSCITLGPGVYNLDKFDDSITSVRKK